MRQYADALRADGQLQVVAGESGFDVGVFDRDSMSLMTVEREVAMARVKAPRMKPVLVCDACDPEEYVRWILRGIWGAVLYSRYVQELPAAVRQVAAGQLWFPPRVIARWMQVDAELHLRAQRTQLTEREREVTELLIRRLSNKEIANVLRISERTVKFHVGNVLAKLHVKSRQELSTIWLRPLRSA